MLIADSNRNENVLIFILFIKFYFSFCYLRRKISQPFKYVLLVLKITECIYEHSEFVKMLKIKSRMTKTDTHLIK